MVKIQDLLQAEGFLLLDGAMGTMLLDAGLSSGECPEAWNVEHPDRVRAIHRSYIEAGSQMILTNSFGGTRVRLERHNAADRTAEYNQAAAKIARLEAQAAPRPVLVAGSMGPTGMLLEPLGKLSYENARAAFEEQAAALARGGADLLWVETMSDLNESKAAIEGARAACDLPIAATMTFDTHGRTMMGVSPEKALQTLGGLDLLAVGANCGTGPDELETVIQKMHALAPDALLIAKANAGLPKHDQGEIYYDGTPEVMAGYAVRVRDAGASLIGACCGSTPAHIRAMAEALQRQPSS